MTSLLALEAAPMLTFHSAKANIYTANYDLIIDPSLAFDKDFYRLGYGGENYDKFLSEQPEA